MPAMTASPTKKILVLELICGIVKQWVVAEDVRLGRRRRARAVLHTHGFILCGPQSAFDPATLTRIKLAHADGATLHRMINITDDKLSLTRFVHPYCRERGGFVQCALGLGAGVVAIVLVIAIVST
jgi:hypothetical protein